MKVGMNRRSFLKTAGAMSLPALTACREGTISEKPFRQVDKREAMLCLLEQGYRQDYIPAAFFLHFDEIYHQGPGAVEKHLEYFRFTGMDFVKIQYEKTFPPLAQIQEPDDWSQMPLYGKDFFEPQLEVVRELVRAAKKEALVLVTLYSPFMCAGHTAGDQVLTRHILENPEKTKRGMEIVTESVLLFVRECIAAGVDGFYASTQGGESERFDNPEPFEECIKPFDLAVMEEINRSCIFNILHICDYVGPYSNLQPFLDYPGDVVNCSLTIAGEQQSPRGLSEYFNRPFMGGLERKGTIATGTELEVIEKVTGVLQDIPERFILGADCTVPNDTNWDNLRTAVRTAHEWI